MTPRIIENSFLFDLAERARKSPSRNACAIIPNDGPWVECTIDPEGVAVFTCERVQGVDVVNQIVEHYSPSDVEARPRMRISAVHKVAYSFLLALVLIVGVILPALRTVL